MPLLSLGCALAIIAAHFLGERLYARPRALSAMSGVTLAFVFLYLLPELSVWQEQFASARVASVPHGLYVVALFGLLAFYGIEQLVLREGPHHARSVAVFGVHLAVFALYNLFVGYLVAHYFATASQLLLFTAASAVHLLGNDHALWNHHRGMYHGRGRWLLAAAILVGWVAGSVVDIGETALAILFAVLAGAVLVNSLKEELPQDRPFNFAPFAAGAAAYAALLVLL